MALKLETYCSVESGTFGAFGNTKNGPTIVLDPAPPYENATRTIACMKALLGKSVTTRAFAEGLNDYIPAFYVRFSNIDPDPFGFAVIQGGVTDTHLSLSLNNGKLEVRDADFNVVATSAAVHFTNNTWHLVEPLFTFGDPGDMVIHVDKIEAVTATAEKFDCGAGTELYLKLSGQGGTPISYTNVWFWSPYIYSGASSVDDFVGPYGELEFRQDENTATPDIGDDLDTGTWQDIMESPFNDANTATYTGVGDRGVMTTDGGGAAPAGPHGDARLDADDEILGATWLWRYTGAYVYGCYGKTPFGDPGVDNTTTTGAFPETTIKKYVLVVSDDAGDVPTRDDYAQLGWEGRWGARKDVPEMLDCVCTLFFKLAPPAYRGLTLGSGFAGRGSDRNILVG